MRILAFGVCLCMLSAPAYAQEARTTSDARTLKVRATADKVTCDGLAASLKLPDGKVTTASVVAAGSFTPPAEGTATSRPITGLPAFCRVQLTLTPSADSDIKSELWLPLTGWNGKFQQVGNGAWAGSIQYGALAEALKRGYAAASSDAGHTGTDASFAMGHPEKLKDFGYRAVHETAVQSKQTITNFYGMAPRLSYFNGCSGGGRMAFQEAQRFPADFDAILAGAPGYNRVKQSVWMLMNAKATLDDPASFIPPAKYAVLHRAALDACDAQDGLKDGLISEPLSCHVDPVATQCTSGDAPNCLTAPQVEAARKLYAGVVHPKTGERIFPRLEPGSELSWGGPAGGPEPLAVGADLFKFVVFEDPTWDFHKFDLARDYDAVHRIDSLDLSPTSPDLKAFVARGGKLLIYQGWADQNVAPQSTVDYYNNVVKILGQKQADDSVRLFFAPGMAHCGGGEGPNVFDALTPLEQWREQGKAPASILATHSTNGKVDRSRPLCPFPQVALYKGSGSVDDAANFACGSAKGEVRSTTLAPVLSPAQEARTVTDARTRKIRATGEQPTCDSLVASLKLRDATVRAASVVPSGSFTPPAEGTATPRPIPGLPAFCRVQLTLTPSADSDIKTEVWMPLTGWNGKFQQVGNGAFAGSIQYAALGEALKRGYAAASTDTGHTGPGAKWAAGHPEKIIDWGYRSEHLTAVDSKQAITNFYGVGPRLSYFTGCSGGGRMAFQEAQRYPADFDAILAGAAAYDRGNEAFGFMAKWQATHETPESFIPTTKYPAIHRAALDACDTLDGLKDGLIGDVLSCRFDPAVLQCRGDRVLSASATASAEGRSAKREGWSDPADPSCLTTAQVEAVRKVYAGARHPKTGELIFPGLEPGSELQWTAVTGGNEPLDVGYDVFKYILLQDPNWDPKTFDLAKDYDRIHKLDNLALSPTNPDLKAFASRGGKLLIYQGWADPNVSPRSPLIYYDRVVKTIGKKAADDSIRLFYAPGMGHCGGGEGPNVFDALTALDQWREQGKAPASIVATHSTDGKVDRTRPLCPYPQIAIYKGTGSIDQADNFYCAEKSNVPASK